METMSVPRRTLCLNLEVTNGDIWFFVRERDWGEKVAMATTLKVSLCSFCDEHLWCQVSRTLLQYFQRNFLVTNLTFFSCKSYHVITDLICIIQKCQYFEKKNAILLYSKGLSNKQKKKHSLPQLNKVKAGLKFFMTSFSDFMKYTYMYILQNKT